MVVNTCAFIDAAREESIGAVLELAGAKKRGAKLAVTGCLAERYGPELAAAMPEIDKVAGFGVPLPVEEPVRLRSTREPQSRVRRPHWRPGRHGNPRGVAELRLVEPASPPGPSAVGVRQGGRGMRQALWLLRHPVVPRPATLAGPQATSWPRWTASASRRSSWWRRTWSPGTGI